MLIHFFIDAYYSYIAFMLILLPCVFQYAIYNDEPSKDHTSEGLPYDSTISNKEEEYDSLTADDDSDEPVISDRRRSRAYYRNKFWPSPRPVNFVRELMTMTSDIQVEGRLTHSKAIKILCELSGLEESLFFNVDPINYSKLFMPTIFNYEKVLGSSIHELRGEISRKGYMDELHAMGQKLTLLSSS
jgi:hypothetical protein